MVLRCPPARYTLVDHMHGGCVCVFSVSGCVRCLLCAKSTVESVRHDPFDITEKVKWSNTHNGPMMMMQTGTGTGTGSSQHTNKTAGPTCYIIFGMPCNSNGMYVDWAYNKFEMKWLLNYTLLNEKSPNYLFGAEKCVKREILHNFMFAAGNIILITFR